MNRSPLTAEEAMPLQAVCQLMAEKQSSSVIILADGQPLGMFTERDVVRHIANHHSAAEPVGKTLVRRVVTVSARTSIDGALEVMHRKRVRRLLITSGGKLAGIITQSNLLDASRRLLHQLSDEQSQLREEVSTDELTGLFNRRAMNQHFAAEINRIQRYGGPLSVVMFDLDRFKQYNDRHGHLAGDKVLKKFGQILKRNCREVDIAARFGGEEFTVLMPAVSSQSAQMFAERVRKEFAATKFLVRGCHNTLTVSAGICERSRHASSTRTMIHLADQALYRAKNSGRNRICLAVAAQKKAKPTKSTSLVARIWNRSRPQLR